MTDEFRRGAEWAREYIAKQCEGDEMAQIGTWILPSEVQRSIGRTVIAISVARAVRSIPLPVEEAKP